MAKDQNVVAKSIGAGAGGVVKKSDQVITGRYYKIIPCSQKLFPLYRNWQKGKGVKPVASHG